MDTIGNDINGDTNGRRLGVSVSLSDDGNILAAGSITNNGQVQVFQYQTSDETWTKLGNDIDGGTYEEAGVVSLGGDGNILPVGAKGVSKVKIYKWVVTLGTWNRLGSDINGESVNDDSEQAYH